MHIKIKQGYDLPVAGAPEQIISAAPPVHSVALLGEDYPGLKADFKVNQGEAVRSGQTLFTDRNNPRVRYTAPGCGVVAAINHGAKRRLASIVIRLSGGGLAGDGVNGDERESFDTIPPTALASAPGELVRGILLRSGLWTAIRERPGDQVAAPGAQPAAMFVNVMDSSPLAADPMVVIAGREDSFYHGLMAISRLSAAPVFICAAPGSGIDASRFPDGVTLATFAGPHPAGLPGTHIHYLAPVRPQGFVWHVGYQDVVAIGQLLTSGRLPTERIIALGGPGVRRPRLLRTRPGACVTDLVAGEFADHGGPADGTRGNWRLISGSVLSGRLVGPELAHLGRFDQQVTVIPETTTHGPGWRTRWFAKGRFRPRLFRLLPKPVSTAMHGGRGGMLPVDAFDRVWGLSVPATPLLRALLVGDVETAMALGCLDLGREDLALCAHVCPGKHDYGAYLERTLRAIVREGFR